MNKCGAKMINVHLLHFMFFQHDSLRRHTGDPWNSRRVVSVGQKVENNSTYIFNSLLNGYLNSFPIVCPVWLCIQAFFNSFFKIRTLIQHLLSISRLSVCLLLYYACASHHIWIMSHNIIAALSLILCDCLGGKEIVIMVRHAVHLQIPGNLCSQ